MKFLIFLKEWWLQRLEYKADKRACQTCKVYEQQVLQLNNEKQQLLKTIMELAKPPVPQDYEEHKFEPIQPRIVPWATRRRMLEEEDRKSAQLLQQQLKEQGERNQQFRTINEEINKIDKELEETGNINAG